MLLDRRKFLLGSLAFPCLSASKKTTGAAPNVLLIVAGDIGSWMLGCYGNKDIRTPNIDLLAKAGTRFANHFAYTPASSPSRATLFTGRLPSQHGIQDSLAPEAAQPPSFTNEITIHDVLAAQGYNCGYVGRWGVGNDSTPQHHCSFWHAAPDGMDAKAAEFLEQQKADKPFFLTVSFFSPEDQAHAARFDEMYAKSTFEAMGRDPGPRDVVGSLRKFAAGVSAIDDRIPPLVTKLKERGLRDNTLVVFCGVNGLLLGRHGLWGDGQATDPVNMYEEVIQVPMIWTWPGRVPVESVRNELVSIRDAIPALCDAAGATPPEGRDLAGRSYTALAFGKPLPKKHPWRNLVFGQYRNTRMVRDSRYKLVSRNQGKGPNELFDLTVDPREKVNRFDNPGFISIRDQLLRQMG